MKNGKMTCQTTKAYKKLEINAFLCKINTPHRIRSYQECNILFKRPKRDFWMILCPTCYAQSCCLKNNLAEGEQTHSFCSKKTKRKVGFQHFFFSFKVIENEQVSCFSQVF